MDSVEEAPAGGTFGSTDKGEMTDTSTIAKLLFCLVTRRTLVVEATSYFYLNVTFAKKNVKCINRVGPNLPTKCKRCGQLVSGIRGFQLSEMTHYRAGVATETSVPQTEAHNGYLTGSSTSTNAGSDGAPLRTSQESEQPPAD
jgi:hypothetical protein